MNYIRPMFSEIYSFTKENLRNIKDYAGVTAVIPDEYRTHHSGFRLPVELIQEGPLYGWQSRVEQVKRHAAVNNLRGDAWPVFPGIAGEVDDSPLLRLIEDADALGMEVWAHMGLWGYTGDVFPEHGLVQVDGEPLPEDNLYWGFPLCPNNDKLVDWTAACMAYAVTHYKVAAIDTDHGHYSPAASLESIFGCACPHCEEKAGLWGYDFAAMKKAVLKLKTALSKINLESFHRASSKSENFMAFLVALAEDNILSDWFRFREQTVANHMSRLRDAVSGATDGKCPLDSHFMPPSIAAFSGQNMDSWTKSIDRFTPGWGPVVGWEQTPALSISNIAKKFSKISGDDPRAYINELIRLFGYGDLNILPDEISKLDSLDYSHGKAFLREIELAKNAIDPSIPFMPPFRIDSFEDSELECYREILKLGGGNFVFSGGFNLGYLKQMSDFLSAENQL